MKAQLYKVKDGYEMVNTSGRLFVISNASGKLVHRACGTIGNAWRSSGALVPVPKWLKGTFFQLLKQ